MSYNIQFNEHRAEKRLRKKSLGTEKLLLAFIIETLDLITITKYIQ